MPSIKSAMKRVRVSEKKRLRNRAVRSRTRTLVGTVRKSVQAGDLQVASGSLSAALSALDRAAAKGVIHPKNAARRKSRLMKALAKATQGS